jgi:hypothetical protein
MAAGASATVCRVSAVADASALPPLDHPLPGGTVREVNRRAFGVYLLLPLLLLSVAQLARGIGADAEGTLLEPGERRVFSELAVPTRFLVEGESFVVEDTLSGRTIVAREIVDEGETLRVDVPQLPVGTFRVKTDDGMVEIDVVPEAGTPVELDGTSVGVPLPAFLGAAAIALVLGWALLRSRRGRKILLVPLLGGAGVLAFLLLRGGDPVRVASWESCAANLGGSPRETELLRRNCKVRFMLDMLEEDGSGAARTEEYMRTVIDPVCHEVVHLVGFYFSRMNPDPAVVERAMLPGCEDGMVHGVLEALSMFHDDRQFVAIVDETCGNFPTARMRKTCAHGLGHATLWRTNGDLQKAWDLCMTATDRREEGHTEAFARKVLPLTQTTFSSRDECHSASVMEWSDRWEFERRVGDTRNLLPEVAEPMDVCDVDGFSELFYVGCYLGTNYRNRDAVEAAERCNVRAPYPVSCFATVGDNLVLFAESNLGTPLTHRIAVDHSRACTLAEDPDAAEACSAALSYRYLLNVRNLERGEELCAALPDVLRGGCAKGLRIAREQLSERGLELGRGAGDEAN